MPIRRKISATTEAAPNGLTTNYGYDLVGNRTSVQDPLGKMTEFTFNARNWQKTVTTPDPDGANGPQQPQTTTFSHDPAGNVTSVDSPGGDAIVEYDALGRKKSVRDPVNNLTQYKYDAAGRVIKVIDPRLKETLYTYDDIGRIDTITDRNGRVRDFDYEADKKYEKWLDGQGNPIRTVTYTYAATTGRLTSVSDPDSTYTYKYDAAGHLTEVDNLGTVGMPRVILVSNFWIPVTCSQSGICGGGRFSEDRLSLTEYALPGGTKKAQVAYEHTQHLLTKAVVSLDNGSNQLAVKATMALDWFYATKQIRLMTRSGSGGSCNSLNPDGYITTEFLYEESTQRLESITHESNHWNGSGCVEATIPGHSYDYDPNSGRLSTYTGPEGTLTYTYDAESGELTGVGGARTESYSFDDNGNRISSHLHGADYDTATGNRLTTDGVYNFTYDDEGNMLTKTRMISDGQHTEFTWDYRNRLTNVKVKTSAGGTLVKEARFRYDANDKLIETKIDANGDGDFVDAVDKVTKTVWDGENPYADFDGKNNNAVLERYLYGTAVDQLFARIDSAGDVDWFLTDHLGSIRQVVDTNGTVLANANYDSFGNLLAAEDADLGRFRYTGREFIVEIGLQYNRARWYDASIGRWISEDPIGFQGGDANLYRYVHNTPTSATDPSGQFLDLLFALAYRMALQGMYYGAIGAAFGAGIGCVDGLLEGGPAGSWDWENCADGAINGAMLGAILGFSIGALGPVGRLLLSSMARSALLDVGAAATLVIGIESAGESFDAGNTGQGLFRLGLGFIGAYTLHRGATRPNRPVNIGGTGEVPDVINLQPYSALKSDFARVGPGGGRTGASLGQMITEGHAFELYNARSGVLPYFDNSVPTVYTNNVPVELFGGGLFPAISRAEIIRILRPGGQWIDNGEVKFTKR